MKIQLLNYTPNPDEIVAAAARVCYTTKSIPEIMEMLLKDPEENKKFVKQLLDMGHTSPFEHTAFTFGIEDVSRALTHQLVRHRIASYSQKSQRYVSEAQFGYYTPLKIEHNSDPEVQAVYAQTMKDIQASYDKLVALGVLKEDARYVLPNACYTSIIVTANARSLFNFFQHRCCSRAQTEIRTAAKEMLELVRDVAPVIFMNAGPNCETLGYCPESGKSCKRKPTLNDIIAGYNSWCSLNKSNASCDKF